MEPFKTHTGIVAILNRANVDTDQIISKEFLKSIKRTGFGEHLFEHWKKNEDGTLNPSFELNRPEFNGASILITGNNFGCGSSREHAVWAIFQYGFRVILAPQKKSNGSIIPGFADIFKNNSGKNGLLCLEFDELTINEMMALVLENPGRKATVDLQNQKIIFDSQKFSFEIDSSLKNRLYEGLDDIGNTEKFESKISQFESKHFDQLS